MDKYAYKLGYMEKTSADTPTLTPVTWKDRAKSTLQGIEGLTEYYDPKTKDIGYGFNVPNNPTLWESVITDPNRRAELLTGKSKITKDEAAALYNPTFQKHLQRYTRHVGDDVIQANTPDQNVQLMSRWYHRGSDPAMASYLKANNNRGVLQRALEVKNTSHPKYIKGWFNRAAEETRPFLSRYGVYAPILEKKLDTYLSKPPSTVQEYEAYRRDWNKTLNYFYKQQQYQRMRQQPQGR